MSTKNNTSSQPSSVAMTDEIPLLCVSLKALSTHVRACAAYANLVGDMDFVDRAIALLQSSPKGASTGTEMNELKEMETRKDAAYLERNQIVAALAKCFPSGVARTNIEGWSPDWHGCVYIGLPTGQVSWHFHDSHAYLFQGLRPYAGAWDGHDTAEKYRRLASLSSPQEASKPQDEQWEKAVIELSLNNGIELEETSPRKALHKLINSYCFAERKSQPSAASGRELPRLPSPDDCIVHAWPSDLERMPKGETFAMVFSVPVGNPSEVSTPLYTADQMREYALSALTGATPADANVGGQAESANSIGIDK